MSKSPTLPTFTDLELQWFQGGPVVSEVVHLVTDPDIVVEVTFTPTLNDTNTPLPTNTYDVAHEITSHDIVSVSVDVDYQIAQLSTL